MRPRRSDRTRARTARRSRRRARTLLALCGALALCGCRSRVPLSISSAPPGAEVRLDGEATGFHTPCNVSVTKGRHTVELALPGYVAARRDLATDGQWVSVVWHEFSTREEVWRFPFWLNIEDFFVPVRKHDAVVPRRIFVRLERAADQ